VTASATRLIDFSPAATNRLSSCVRAVGNMRILIVEDNERMSLLLQEALRGIGYGVDTVATSTDFLSAAKDVPYDLFIVDLMLPHGEMD
jgi:CheY-like chemotaxis protein